MQTAMAMSNILSKHEIAHAFIGGFAINLLGHTRETTDVDVEVDIAEGTLTRSPYCRNNGIIALFLGLLWDRTGYLQ